MQDYPFLTSRAWKFAGLVAASPDDVKSNNDLIEFWKEAVRKYPDAAGERPVEIKLGEALARIELPESYRLMPTSSVSEYLDSAIQHGKSHQIPALTAAAKTFGIAAP